MLDSIETKAPVRTYHKEKAKEKRLNFSNFANMDVKSFDSPIGGITNTASNLSALCANFEKGSKEYNEIKKRIILLRRF